MGPAISLSSHVYNADPSLPLMNTHLNVSKVSLLVAQIPLVWPEETPIILCMSNTGNRTVQTVQWQQYQVMDICLFAYIPNTCYCFIFPDQGVTVHRRWSYPRILHLVTAFKGLVLCVWFIETPWTGCYRCTLVSHMSPPPLDQTGPSLTTPPPQDQILPPPLPPSGSRVRDDLAW